MKYTLFHFSHTLSYIFHFTMGLAGWRNCRWYGVVVVEEEDEDEIEMKNYEK